MKSTIATIRFSGCGDCLLYFRQVLQVISSSECVVEIDHVADLIVVVRHFCKLCLEKLLLCGKNLLHVISSAEGVGLHISGSKPLSGACLVRIYRGTICVAQRREKTTVERKFCTQMQFFRSTSLLSFCLVKLLHPFLTFLCGQEDEQCKADYKQAWQEMCKQISYSMSYPPPRAW